LFWKSALEPLVIVPCVGKLLLWCEGSRISSGGGGGKLGSAVLFWCAGLVGIG
jgi:hypothetical protein